MPLQKNSLQILVSVICLVLLSATTIPALEKTVQVNYADININKLQIDINPANLSLFPQTNRDGKGFGLSDAFVLCELRAHSSTRLNICYQKKKNSNETLDIRRFLLELTLHF